MTEFYPSPAFPVVFFDGDREIDIGTVVVDPALGFKKFQFLISEKIGISPHQISLSLVRRKKARMSPEIRRKLPIDESSDFSAIARERDCFVLAVLKRSRRERRGRPRRNLLEGGGDDFLTPDKKAIQVPEKTILRRPAELYGRAQAAATTAEEGLGMGLGFWNYEGLRNLQGQRQRYLISTAAASYHPYMGAGPAEGYMPEVVEYHAGAVACKVCSATKEGPVPFHWCVYDRVTEGFRSNVGPIQRPPKGQVRAPPA